MALLVSDHCILHRSVCLISTRRDSASTAMVAAQPPNIGLTAGTQNEQAHMGNSGHASASKYLDASLGKLAAES